MLGGTENNPRNDPHRGDRPPHPEGALRCRRR
jgi:hypothetical protein